MKKASLPGFFLTLGLTFVACGGGGSGSNEDAPNSSDDLKDVTVLEGQWASGLCTVKADGQSALKSVYIVTKVNDAGITLRSGALTYATGNCSGSGILSEFTTDLGSVEFSKTLVLGASQYFRGVYSVSNGTKTPIIWALPTAQKLCIVTDAEPTVFTSAQSIKDYVDILAADICYYKI